MANKVIGGTATGATALPVAGSIDRGNDLLPIYTASVNATQAITPNNMLGISGSPVGTSDSQTLTNKIIGNTNAATLKDTSFTLQDDGDTTKQLTFQLSGITTGNTRVVTVPDASLTLVGTGTTQTLTNKTLTSPTINAPTITNATLSADSITGFTVSSNGTIYGMSVTGGILASAAIAGQVNTAAIQANAVAASNLATNAITLGFASSTSNFTLSSSQTTPTQVTGLTVTVTIPSGGRKVKITAYSGSFTVAAGAGNISIWDGTVNSGTQLASSNSSATSAVGLICQAIATPAAGSKTYNVGTVNTGTNNNTLAASSIQPMFILVEVI